MSKIYIWHNKSGVSRHTKDIEGKLPTKVVLPPDGTINYTYHWSGSNLEFVEYRKNGKIHRDGDNPAVVHHNGDGIIKSVSYYKNGERHRVEDKPAWVWYYNDGSVEIETYYKDGRVHRDGDEPAVVMYHKDGGVKYVEYCELPMS